MARTDRALSPCAAAGLRNALRSSASWHALHSCWSWFARPGSRDVLTQETECSPQLGPLTAGHICMRGDFAPPPVVGDVDERPDECGECQWGHEEQFPLPRRVAAIGSVKGHSPEYR